MKSKLFIVLFLVIGFSLFALPIIYLHYAALYPTEVDLSWTTEIPIFIIIVYLGIMDLSFILSIVLMIRGLIRRTYREPTLFLVSGLSMFVVMVNYSLYAVNHPTLGFPWSSDITVFIYKMFVGIMALSFMLAIWFKVIYVLKKINNSITTFELKE